MLTDALQKGIWAAFSIAVVFVMLFALLFTNKQVQVAIGTWTFDTASDYYTSSSSIAIGSGLASLQTSGGGGGGPSTTQQYVDNDNGGSEFGGGTHSGTQYSGASTSIQLISGSSTGQFTARIIDAGANADWTSLSWSTAIPHKPFPDGTNAETGYTTGTIRGADILSLWHFDEGSYSGSAGEVIDSSQYSYDLQTVNGVAIINDGKFHNAAEFDQGVQRYMTLSTAAYLNNGTTDATSGTISAWIRPAASPATNHTVISAGTTGNDFGRIVFGLTTSNVPLIYHAAASTNNGSGTTDDYLYGTVGLTANEWNHVAWVSDGSTYRTYVNGVEDTTLAVQFGIGANSGDWFGDMVQTTDVLLVGATIASGGVTEFSDADIDELAVFDRPMGAEEISLLYQRGISRVQLQVRSCDDAACSGESFVGPDGTSATHYTDATSTFSGPTTTITNLSQNRYFQYQASFFTSNTAFTPEIFAVTTTASVAGAGGSYPTNTPYIGNNVGFPFLTLTSFSQTLGGGNAGSIEYQIAVDTTSTWYYHDGVNWTAATSGYPGHTNTTAEITTNAQTIDDDLGSGILYWRGFFVSDGTEAVVLDTVAVETTSTIFFTSSTDSVAESAATTSIQVRLDEASSSTVSVTYGVSGGTATNSSTDYLLATGTVSIVAGDTTATFSIYIAEDALIEGNETIIISLSNAQGGLLGSTSTHTLTIIDNDSPSVNLSTTTLAVTEGGVTSTYTIVLGSAPSTSVEIILATSSEDLSISTTSIIFTSTTYSTPVIVVVTAVDDAIIEGTHTRTITHTASSSDGNYDGIAIATVTTTITDNDTAAVTLTTTTLAITESATSSYDISLATSPSSSVTITLSTSSADVLLSTTTIVFTSANYSTPVTVVVTAVNDDIDTGSTYERVISHSASSADTNYDGISIANVTTTITDNDTAGVTVTTSTVAITEAGTTATYTIQLDSQPTSTVTVTVSPDSASTVSTSSIAFTSSNWNTPVTVTVTAVDDDVAQGAHSTTITHSASQTGGQYNSISIASVDMTITDNDTVGVTITTSSIAISEAGTTATYTIQLATQPTTSVTIALSADAQSNVSTSSIVFTSSTWDTPVTVTVTAVDDASVEGNHTTTITHSATQGGSAQYNGISIASVVMNITDNDTAGVSIVEPGGGVSVTEGGTTATYTIQLNTSPASPVTITVTTDGEVSVSTSSIVFTSGNYNTPVIVTTTATDDSIAEGTHTSVITHSASSGDGTYDGISIANVTTTITDNDTAGVTVTTSTVAITEAGTTATYTIQLDSQPTSTVTVTVSPDSASTVSTSSIAFTSSNWNTPVTVTVTATDDGNIEGAHSTTITHTATQSGGQYNGISIASVVMNITDNDSAGVTITESGGSTTITEGGATDTYTIVLNTSPASPVEISVATDGNSTVSTSSIIFTSANYNTAITVTVTAVDDSIAQGSRSSVITHTASSSDGNYDGISIASVTSTITDNDTAGVTITESGGSTNITEAGGTDSYTIVLSSQPTSSVTITLTTSSQILVSTSSIVFTSSTWNSAVTVTVSTIDDNIAEGAHTGTITHTATQSGGQYQGISISSVTANITDNDTAGVTVTETDGDTTTTEDGVPDTYTIVLNTAPTSPVVITLAATNGEVSLSTTSIYFTSTTYNVAVTVTTTAIDDSDVEGTHTDSITHTASSSDSNYNGISISSITVTITDNEPSVTIGSTSLSIQEGNSDTVSVVLVVAPTTTVTITPTSSSQVSLSTTSLTFTSANWNTPQTLTVTAVEDNVTEGTHATIISYSVSSTGNYNGISVSSTIVTITELSSGSSNNSGGGLAAFALFTTSPSTNVNGQTSPSTTESATTSNQTTTPQTDANKISSSPESLKVTPNTTPSRFLPLIIGEISDAVYMLIASPGSDLPLEYKPFTPKKQWNLCGSSANCPDGTYTVTVLVYNEFFEQIYSRVYTTELKKLNFTEAEGKPLLIKHSDDSSIYLVENGIRRWIPSEAVFKSRGYDWNDVRTLASLDEYLLGEPLPGKAIAEGLVSQFTQYLSFGARNTQVRALQVLLKDLGFFPANIEATGYYGQITQASVINFQQRNAITPLGVVRPLTRSFLNTFLNR